MKNKSIISLIIAAAAATGIAEHAAAQTTSPYSRFGYGLLRESSNEAQRQMGGTGYAMHSGREVNAMNPASYAMTDSMTFLFDMGLDFSYHWREETDAKDRDWGGGLDYVAIQFPVTKWMGVSVGLTPYSSVGYSFGSTVDNGVASHQGTGGLNELYVGAGFKPFKGFSVGFNVSYFFGNIVNDVYATTSTTAAIFEQMMEVRDWHMLFGAQYVLRLSRRASLTAGLTFSPAKTLLGETYITEYLQNSSGTSIATEEVDRHNLKNNFSLPYTWGAGLAFDWDQRLHVEADYTYQPWAKAKFTELDGFSYTPLANRWKVALGGSYIPNPRGGYAKCIAYRVGGFYNRDYVTVGTNNVRDWGVACGVGLPAISSKTVINVGLEYHQREAYPQMLLKERYLSLTLGVTFNQVWFFRNKLR